MRYDSTSDDRPDVGDIGMKSNGDSLDVGDRFRSLYNIFWLLDPIKMNSVTNTLFTHHMSPIPVYPIMSQRSQVDLDPDILN